MVSCMREQTTGCRWGWQVLSQKQVNMMQGTPQSHRHERQGESSQDSCSVVPTLTAARLLRSAPEGGPSGGVSDLT